MIGLNQPRPSLFSLVLSGDGLWWSVSSLVLGGDSLWWSDSSLVLGGDGLWWSDSSLASFTAFLCLPWSIDWAVQWWLGVCFTFRLLFLSHSRYDTREIVESNRKTEIIYSVHITHHLCWEEDNLLSSCTRNDNGVQPVHHYLLSQPRHKLQISNSEIRQRDSYRAS